MRAVGMGRGDRAASGGESAIPGFAADRPNVKFIVSTIILAVGSLHAQDPLPSWNDTAPKKAIVAFVERVTKEGSPDFQSLSPTSRRFVSRS